MKIYFWELSAFYMVFKAIRVNKDQKDVGVDRIKSPNYIPWGTALLRASRVREKSKSDRSAVG